MTTQANEQVTSAQPPPTRPAPPSPAQAATAAGAAFFTGLLFLAGLYLVLSPWVIASTGQLRVAASNVIVGVALMLLTAGFARSTERLRSLAWVTPVLGAWVIAAPWAVYRGSGIMPVDIDLPLSTATVVSNIVAGAIVLLAGAGLTWHSRHTPGQ